MQAADEGRGRHELIIYEDATRLLACKGRSGESMDTCLQIFFLIY